MTEILGEVPTNIVTHTIIPSKTVKLPEFMVDPEPNCFGQMKCYYCGVTYYDRFQYRYHLKTKKKCRIIRQAFGLAVEIREFYCNKCGKAMSTKHWRDEHQWSCTAVKLTVKPFDDTIPPELSIKPFKINEETES